MQNKETSEITIIIRIYSRSFYANLFSNSFYCVKKIKEKKETQIEVRSDEQLPIHESLEIIKAYTFRKSDKWWTAIAATKSKLSKNPKAVLAFYRWRKSKNGEWKRIKKWTINSMEDWEKFKKIINEEFADILWK